MMTTGSLHDGIPAELPDEMFETLCEAGSTRIERIVSRRHASPEGFWYDQAQNEFVLVVKGSAGLRFADREETVVLKTGDYVNIPAGVKHRVEWTDGASETIWLAVFY